MKVFLKLIGITETDDTVNFRSLGRDDEYCGCCIDIEVFVQFVTRIFTINGVDEYEMSV